MTQQSSSTLDDLTHQFDELRYSITQWRNDPEKKSMIPEALKEKIGYLFSQGFSTTKLQSIGISYKQAKRWANQYCLVKPATKPEAPFTFVSLPMPVATNETTCTLLKITFHKGAVQATIECDVEHSIQLLKALGF